jgi:hypothetical protein
MTDPTFRATIRPELHPDAAGLVAIYEAVPGALTYPGAMPEGIAAVLDQIAGLAYGDVADLAALLRGEQP